MASTKALPPTRALLTLALTCAGLAACAPSLPQRVVAQYGQALKADNPRDAYELLSPELRARVSFEDFADDWKQRRKALHSVQSELINATQQPARVEAQIAYSDYDTLTLRLREDGWRITGGVLDVASQDTPRQALVSFVRAMEARRYERLMLFVPERYAQHMDADMLKADFEKRSDEIDTLIAELKANLDNPIVERDDRATMNYGPRRVTFVRENKVWKIADPD